MRTVLAAAFVLRALRSARAHSSRLTLALGVHQAKVFKGEAADGEEAKTFIRDAQVLMCLCACAFAFAHLSFCWFTRLGRVAAGWQQRYLHALADLTLRAGEHYLPLWLRGWRKISCVRGVLF